MRKIQFAILLCQPSLEFGGTVLWINGAFVREPVCDLNRRELPMNRTSTQSL